MEITNTKIITLTTEDVEKAIVEYLQSCGHLEEHGYLEKKKKDYSIFFNISSTREGEDLYSPGYQVNKFEGCTITIKK